MLLCEYYGCLIHMFKYDAKSFKHLKDAKSFTYKMASRIKQLSFTFTLATSKRNLAYFPLYRCHPFFMINVISACRYNLPNDITRKKAFSWEGNARLPKGHANIYFIASEGRKCHPLFLKTSGATHILLPPILFYFFFYLPSH